MTLIDPNDEWRVSAQPTMSTKHDVIKPSDPHDCARRQELDCAICDGGLAVCRRCGEYEAGLEKPCVPRNLSGVHDSDNCILGPNDTPCDMCVAAAESERRAERGASLDEASARAEDCGFESRLNPQPTQLWAERRRCVRRSWT